MYETVSAYAGNALFFQHGENGGFAASGIPCDDKVLRHAAERQGACAEVIGGWTGKRHGPSGQRMPEGEVPGVQHLAGRQTAYGTWRVDGVSEQRVPEACEMNADLVRAAREDVDAQKRGTASGRLPELCEACVRPAASL